MAVIAWELIDANVRLRLTANRTYGLLFVVIVIVAMAMAMASDWLIRANLHIPHITV
ncbi:hypothetical protein [Aeromonas salmonicida]|uniref:hypothetical protein n=1 Tax=Aeromonas salmonicida TaxID=645 RepID=UPI001F3CC912|nr:hypothetical protein [Aeromonas salmonicida]